MNEACCNVCGERLHMGCCNPNRTALRPLHAAENGGAVAAALSGCPGYDEIEATLRAEVHDMALKAEAPGYKWRETSFAVADGVGNLVTREVAGSADSPAPTLALTDHDAQALTAAIHRAGYCIGRDMATGELTLFSLPAGPR